MLTLLCVLLLPYLAVGCLVLWAASRLLGPPPNDLSPTMLVVGWPINLAIFVLLCIFEIPTWGRADRLIARLCLPKPKEPK